MLAKNVNGNTSFQDEKWCFQLFREQARSHSGIFYSLADRLGKFLAVLNSSVLRKKAEIQAYKASDKLYTIIHRYHAQEGRLQ